MKNSMLLVILSIFMFNCTNNDDDDNDSQPQTTTPTTISKVCRSLNPSGLDDFDDQNTIIKSQSEWESFKNQINLNNDLLIESDIDFNQYDVIVVLDQIRESGGYCVEVDYVESPSELKVMVTKVLPGPNDIFTQMFTLPFYMAKIPKNNLSIVFETTSRERD